MSSSSSWSLLSPPDAVSPLRMGSAAKAVEVVFVRASRAGSLAGSGESVTKVYPPLFGSDLDNLRRSASSFGALCACAVTLNTG